MRLTQIIKSSALASVVLFSHELALAEDQLDRELEEVKAAPAPEGVLVKVDKDTQEVTVYSIDKLDPVVKTKEFKALGEEERNEKLNEILAKSEPELNAIAVSEPTTDMDRFSSTEANFLRYRSHGWAGPTYAYYNYQPTYYARSTFVYTYPSAYAVDGVYANGVSWTGGSYGSYGSYAVDRGYYAGGVNRAYYGNYYNAGCCAPVTYSYGYTSYTASAYNVWYYP